jgi:tight adherence protein B
MLWMILGLTFGSVATLSLTSCPRLLERVRAHLSRKTQEATLKLEQMFITPPRHKLTAMYILPPVVIGLLGAMTTGKWVYGAVGAVVGLYLPKVMLESVKRRWPRKFHGQMVDSLLLVSSGLKAGLSMTQAFTVVAEEMPPPSSQEFGLVLKELHMGVSFEEAMVHLKQRLPSDDVNLFVTSVLVARETGGDITGVFAKLVETIRERMKIRERIKTLTFMARMQGLIMGFLPIVFSYAIYAMDRDHFTFFLTDPLGKVMLAGVVFLQAVVFFLFVRFSRTPL